MLGKLMFIMCCHSQYVSVTSMVAIAGHLFDMSDVVKSKPVYTENSKIVHEINVIGQSRMCLSLYCLT